MRLGDGAAAALIAAAMMIAGFAGSPQPAAATFATFESGQVRPLALSPAGSRLFAVNTPDDRLEIFAVNGGALTHVDSVPVGLEPVAVAARSAISSSSCTRSTRRSRRSSASKSRSRAPTGVRSATASI